ncbi:hypothetical protein C100_11860 [Sphingobium sp. C100]|nr:hypothetical protein C100_11860 [Sphingobium sp. C100]
MAPGIAISGRRDGERTGMGRHVKTVGQKRHGAGQPAKGDFDQHRYRSQPYDPQGPLGILVVPGAQIDMVEIMAFLGIARNGGEGVMALFMRMIVPMVMSVRMVIVVHRHFP